MVTSPHALASQAGIDILEKGGNAIEAAVAMAAVLAVVMPHFCGLGGDAVWLIADRQGRRRALLGIGQAASKLPVYKSPIDLRGPSSMVTSACAVDSWDHALAFSARHWNGKQRLGDLVSPAIGLAADGFEPSRSQNFWLEYRSQELAQWPGFSRQFDHRERDGLFRQADLADSLTLLSRQGCRSFYEGVLGRKIADGLAAIGSPLTAADLAATRTRHAEPISLDYRGVTMLAPPPPTQGISTLAILGILSRFDLPSFPALSTARYHLLVEAVKQAFLDRACIADPEFTPVPSAKLLDSRHLDTKAAMIDRGKALPWPHLGRDGDTVFFAATDAQGQCASVLQSTYFDWGSGVIVGDTGILWHNRGAAFSIETDSVNVVEPAKRPFFTLNPGIALKNDAPFLLYGTQGADGQPQTLSVILTGLIDHGMTPQEALAQPRFLLGRTFSDSRDSLKLERSIGEEINQELSLLGHDIALLPTLSPIFGQAGIIRCGDSMSGAHDPRGEGIALSIPS
ncbi:gamma-glutamyltransferase [Phyllobacterium sp. 21LDTY02-6]|uniref:gamma-glutamyltransferase family protein n=1 Tax=Phyllobacterium sp. 21LDTY02-6 TaxID=2944903 RepID=UPI002020517E|nr:gamma-glutamyltransferase [Phyllobacterium sp. 21LDTY02-6]MCO4319055.1 gamma-glutamyltransferase [Phyllobacterium sp. 21LDTY02-6]